MLNVREVKVEYGVRMAHAHLGRKSMAKKNRVGKILKELYPEGTNMGTKPKI